MKDSLLNNNESLNRGHKHNFHSMDVNNSKILIKNLFIILTFYLSCKGLFIFDFIQSFVWKTFILETQ